MRKSSAAVLAIALTALTGVSPAAHATAGDIPWKWNDDGDKDVRAQFRATGEHFDVCTPSAGWGYVLWSAGGASGRLDNTKANSCYDFNLDFPEGTSVSMKVCEEKNLYKDDCSGTYYGRA